MDTKLDTAELKSGTRRRLLREFLIARRAQVAPDDVGLPAGTRRRTPGLRREELASLAGVGVTWYTWFEQGREIQVSSQVLSGLARVLRLTPTETEYLYSLASVPYEGSLDNHPRLPTDLQAALDGFRTGPAIVFGPRLDVEAFNDVADAIFRFGECKGLLARNHVWRLFMDPSRRRLYLDWEDAAEKSVSRLRFAYRRRIGDPGFDHLIQSLTEGREDFRRMWSAQRTNNLPQVLLGLTLPGIGPFYLASVRFQLSDPEDHFLFLLPPVDDQGAEAIRLLMRQASRP